MNTVEVHEPTRIALSDINFAPYNPRVMPPQEMESLKQSLLKHGLVLNLVVQKKGMVLIGGHQRVRAMRELYKDRQQEIPTHVWGSVLDVDDATAKQLNIALNKISGQFDDFMLGDIMASLPVIEDLDAIAMGFDKVSIDALIKSTVSPEVAAHDLDAEAAAIVEGEKTITYVIDFETADEKRELLTWVQKEKERGICKSGSALLRFIREHSK